MIVFDQRKFVLRRIVMASIPAIINHGNHIIMSTNHHQVVRKCKSSGMCKFTGENTLERETMCFSRVKWLPWSPDGGSLVLRVRASICIHSLVYSSILSFIHSFTHSFCHSCIFCFIHLFMFSFFYSFFHFSFVHSFILSLVHSFIPSFIPSFID